MFSRAQPRDESGQFTSHRAQAESVADAIKGRWKNAPDIVVIDTMADAPARVAEEYDRQNSQGAGGDVEGFYFGGKVYLVADALDGPGDVVRVLFHEALGHAGLRGVFGEQLAPILNQIATLRGDLLAPIAERYGLNLKDAGDRRIAAEEALAHLAQTRPEIGYVKRAVAAIRTWLRENVPGFDKMEMTDGEIIRNFLEPARDFVERGQQSGAQTIPLQRTGDSRPAYARSAATRDAYDARIDALFAGEPANRSGARVLDSSDLLGLLGYANTPVYLQESKVIQGTANHPQMTADTWKKIPQWLDSPAAVFDSETVPGRLVVVAPELVAGAPALIIVEPNAKVGSQPLVVHLLVNAYDAQGGKTPFARWARDGLLKYADQKKFPDVLARAGLQLPSTAVQNKPGTKKILSEKNLSGYRRANGLDGAMFSRAADPRDPTTFAGKATDAFNDLMGSTKTFNGWWHKTVGTQYHKAEKDRDFKRVFDATQAYIGDVSRLANDAADLARDLLPKLERVGDVLKGMTKADDVKAIGKPIFQGTLADKRVYEKEELRRVFKLTDKQIELYQQFTAATAKSLDILTTTTVAKLVNNADLTARVADAIETSDHAAIADFLEGVAKNDAKMKPLAAQVRETSDRANQLKAEGYAPLMRFGQYAVSARDPKTKALQEFYLFESQFQANRKARELEATGNFEVDRSVMAQEDYKLLGGVSPESLELFGDILARAGVMDAKDEVFQQYVRNAVAQRSAMTRMLERQGYPGYSTDVRRVLASFITSNARLGAKNLHFSEMLGAAESIPTSKGDVRDEATKLVTYVQNPVEEASLIRGLLFVKYIGGSAASAITNLTQSVTMTLPYLSQFSNPASAAGTLASAMRDAATGVEDKELGEALVRAEQAGVVSPQEIHHLNAEAMATFGANPVVQRALFLWGSMFSAAEQYNRRVAFIAGWNTAKASGKADPYEFATKTVEETQGVYNKGNRPNWARGAVGATLFTFKQFSIGYVEFLSRLPAREKALALGILFLAAGAEGPPFADDIDDVVDTVAQRLYEKFGKGPCFMFSRPGPQANCGSDRPVTCLWPRRGTASSTPSASCT